MTFYEEKSKLTWNLFFPVVLFGGSALFLLPVLLSPRIKSCRYPMAAARAFSDLDEDCKDASEQRGQ